MHYYLIITKKLLFLFHTYHLSIFNNRVLVSITLSHRPTNILFSKRYNYLKDNFYSIIAS